MVEHLQRGVKPGSIMLIVIEGFYLTFPLHKIALGCSDISVEGTQSNLILFTVLRLRDQKKRFIDFRYLKKIVVTTSTIASLTLYKCSYSRMHKKENGKYKIVIIIHKFKALCHKYFITVCIATVSFDFSILGVCAPALLSSFLRKW